MIQTLVRKLFITVLFCLSAHFLWAEFVNIGIIEQYNVRRFSFLVETGSYQVFAGSEKITDLNQGDLLFLVMKENGIEVKSPKHTFGSYNKVYIIGKESQNVFRVTPIEPDKAPRNYDDNLRVSLKNEAMRLVNNVDIENYIAGVVQAEVGPTPAPEFFKLQSILCRTYTLENLKKHEHEGYNLCDRVHCQAYYKKCSDADIEKASKSTKGLVIVDSEINLITAAFYSNCGGQTTNSEDVWQKPVYYLKSVNDPHCVNQPNAKWSKVIPKQEWMDYLNKKAGVNGADKESLQPTPFYQQKRTAYYTNGNLNIPLKTVRSDWKLKSTYFDVIPNGETMILNGRGFGHGAGLCQEGAMKMAASGYSYPDILHFYYKDVHLIDMSALDFFREE